MSKRKNTILIGDFHFHCFLFMRKNMDFDRGLPFEIVIFYANENHKSWLLIGDFHFPLCLIF